MGETDWSRVDWREVFGGKSRRRAGGGAGGGRQLNLLLILALVLFVLPAVLGAVVTFVTDLQWFRSVGQEQVFLRRYTAAFAAFAVFFFAFFAWAALNAWIALRPRPLPRVVDVGEPVPSVVTPRLVALVLLVPSLFFGLAAAARWDDLLRFLNAVEFGAADPVFGLDIGFYFFTLPVLSFLQEWAAAAVLLVGLGVLGVHLVRGAAVLARSLPSDRRTLGASLAALTGPARIHLSILGALFLLLVAVGYQLDRFDLLFRTEGAFLTGAGYTSVFARLPALTLLTAVAALAALALLVNVRLRALWLLGGALAVWLGAGVLVGGVYPEAVERLVVQPAQLERERPYIQRHIEATRAAYDIADVEISSFDVRDRPTAAEVAAQTSTIENVRLWDYRALQQILTQLQTLRGYYEFHDVDVTRVEIDGRVRQIMVSARELEPARVPQSWVNLHLRFTHGYGATGAPVALVTGEGQPSFTLRDIPPIGEPLVERPQIYFGELTRQYVIVGTTEEEFDYPEANIDRTTRFEGDTGISIGSVWDRLLFAARFRDLNMLISSQITSESQLLMHRQIAERAQLIAPFLTYDRDPYIAFDGGRLFWIHDAYTTGERYPYSDALANAPRVGAEGIGHPSLNYIRNSVKVVTDAYDGTIRFYIAEPDDPVVRTYAAIYPDLFRPLEELSPGLRAQLRYPEDLFRVQAAIFGRYHVTDPAVFYNGSDQWQLATEILAQAGRPEAVEPYYVIAQLPDSEDVEFLLFVPMTPNGRDNMIAWLAGRSDEPHYGELRALRFATDRAIFGPMQIEARIDADPIIKTELALLSQAGTETLRGNLLVIPVGSSFLYVEPIFIRAREGAIPELRRVVVATQERLVMSNTLGNALSLLLGAEARPPGEPPPPPVAGTPAEVAALIRSANEHYERAQAALRQGDFATFGSALAALEADLRRLEELTGVAEAP